MIYLTLWFDGFCRVLICVQVSHPISIFILPFPLVLNSKVAVSVPVFPLFNPFIFTLSESFSLKFKFKSNSVKFHFKYKRFSI